MGFDNDEENGNVVGNDRDGQDVRVEELDWRENYSVFAIGK